MEIILRSVAQTVKPFLADRRPDRQTKQSTNLLAKRNQRDLVICPHYFFENRWKTKLVDYAIVERWNPIRLQMDNSSLRRLKIYQLARVPTMSLLRNLESHNKLIHLELDELELILDEKITSFSLKSLQVLSIDSIIAVDADENRVPRGRVIAEFNAEVLHRVCLGKSLLFIKCFTK